MTSQLSKKDQLLQAIAKRRGLVLNIVESEVGDTPMWKSLRARLLGALGENGLLRDVKRIMVIQENQGAGDE